MDTPGVRPASACQLLQMGGGCWTGGVPGLLLAEIGLRNSHFGRKWAAGACGPDSVLAMAVAQFRLWIRPQTLDTGRDTVAVLPTASARRTLCARSDGARWTTIAEQRRANSVPFGAARIFRLPDTRASHFVDVPGSAVPARKCGACFDRGETMAAGKRGTPRNAPDVVARRSNLLKSPLNTFGLDALRPFR
jgi:hypothetical protein